MSEWHANSLLSCLQSRFFLVSAVDNFKWKKMFCTQFPIDSKMKNESVLVSMWTYSIAIAIADNSRNLNNELMEIRIYSINKYMEMYTLSEAKIEGNVFLAVFRSLFYLKYACMLYHLFIMCKLGCYSCFSQFLNSYSI